MLFRLTPVVTPVTSYTTLSITVNFTKRNEQVSTRRIIYSFNGFQAQENPGFQARVNNKTQLVPSAGNPSLIRRCQARVNDKTQLVRTAGNPSLTRWCQAREGLRQVSSLGKQVTSAKRVKHTVKNPSYS